MTLYHYPHYRHYQEMVELIMFEVLLNYLMVDALKVVMKLEQKQLLSRLVVINLVP